MRHQFEGGMTVGTQHDPPEGYSNCANCGAEETDENRDEECAPPEEDGPPALPILPPYDDGLRRGPCFKDWREHLEESGMSVMDALAKTLQEGDKICMAEAGHVGEHDFTRDDEVEITYTPKTSE